MRRDPLELAAAVAAPAALQWRHVVAWVAVLGGALLLAYRDTVAAMVQVWTSSETFAHGLVVPFIVAWLVWRRRHELLAQPPRPTTRFLPWVAGAGFLWLLGELGAVNAASQFALMAMLVGTVASLVGRHAARTLLFPLGFLFFAVPLGDFMLPTLMVWTADFATTALRLSGVPVFREGQQIFIPTGTWSVVEACSGIRYLIASLMVGTLFAHVNYRSTRRRLAFVAASIAVPIVANWLRAYIIIMLGHLSDNRIAVGVDHLLYGWVFFGLVIFPMFIIGARWREAEETAAERKPVPGIPVRRASAARLASAAAVVLVAPIVIGDVLTRHEAAATPVLSAAPALGGWRPSTGSGLAWQPAYQEASAELNQVYVAADGEHLGVYIGYYRKQDYERKLVSSRNALVRNEDRQWRLAGSGHRGITVDGSPLDVRTARVLSVGAATPGLMVWQFYWINGRLTASDVRAKAYGVFYRLIGRGDDAATIVLYTPLKEGAGERVLEAFLNRNLAVITAQLRATRDGNGTRVAQE